MKKMMLVLEELRKVYPRSFHSSNQDPFYILIFTILSQRTRDENTAKAAKQLFSRFRTPKHIANASINDIRKLIRPSGFYNVKAKRVKEVSRILVKDYGSKVPSDADTLVKLPGVGYKTAGCVMVYAFGKPEIPVDVHVAVMAQRLGWTKEKHADSIRLDLMKKIPKRNWLDINELFVRHGQSVCFTRKPKCKMCAVSSYCDFYSKIYKK